MTAPTTDPNPDTPFRDEDRGSVDAADRPRATGEDDKSPDAMNGATGGTDGVTKNQDDTAQ